MSFTFGDLRSFVARVQKDPTLIGRLLFSLHSEGTPEHWHYAQDSLKEVDYQNTNLGDVIVWFGKDSATSLQTRMGECDPVELGLFLSALARKVLLGPQESCISCLGGAKVSMFSWASPKTLLWEMRLEGFSIGGSLIENREHIAQGIIDPI